MTFGWERFDNPPYSPDLVPSDLLVFLHLKTFLGGQRFHDDNKVKEAVNTWSALQAAHSTMQGYNWCTAPRSASTMVETMSNSSVRYVHQMAIYCFLFQNKVMNLFYSHLQVMYIYLYSYVQTFPSGLHL
jgi:hypothetical protein